MLLLSPLRFVVVGSFPSGPAMGDAVVLSSNGHLYVYDGAAWVDNGAASAGSSGLATVDFGASPGTSFATVDVTGQAAILSGSRLRAWVEARTTADHNAEEHAVETLRVTAGNIVEGVSFTIYAVCDLGLATGLFSVGWQWE